jgi:TPR repeat protein
MNPTPSAARNRMSLRPVLGPLLLGACLAAGAWGGAAHAAQDVAQSSAGTKEAISDYDAGNYPVARSEFKVQADKGDRLAEFNYAMMVLNGEGGPADFDTAKLWLKRAAEAGMSHAQYAYGRLFDDGSEVPRDTEEAHRWYLLAAQQGHVLAEVALANQFFIGRGAPRDDAQAFHWYQLAAKAGDLTSQYVVGSYYEYGRGGVAKNLNIARFWYAQAGAQGDPAGLGKFRELSQELAREHAQQEPHEAAPDVAVPGAAAPKPL